MLGTFDLGFGQLNFFVECVGNPVRGAKVGSLIHFLDRKKTKCMILSY